MKTEIKKRTFDALNFPKESEERKKLNCDVLTSEYMTSQKYILFVYHPETEINFAYVSQYTRRTKSECEEKETEFKNL